MATTQCYAMVRGSALRLTGLDRCGGYDSGPIRYAVSKSVAKITINEISEGGSNEVLRSNTDERRLHFVRPAQTIRYLADIEFLRTDPAILSLIAGASLVYGASAGFGDAPFGLTPFGGGGPIIGFDARTKVPATAFAMEVWSNLANEPCATRPAGFGEGDFGEFFYGDSEPMFSPPRRWGYTLFPFLKGGIISGFSFANGLVSFNLRAAQTRRGSQWGLGPHRDDQLLTPVSRNLDYRQTITYSAPPSQTDGVVEISDVIDGGTATMTSSDVLDGEFVVTSPSVVDGGRA